jgi:phage tail-like protein
MAFGLQTAALNAGASALGLRFDAAPAWKFYVEILGVVIAQFDECSGLSMEREVKEVREGGTNDFEWLLPGQIKYGPVTLKRGITYNRELWRWFRWGMLDGQVWGVHTVPGASMAISLLKMAGVIVPQGTHMSIILGTVDGKKARHWDLIGAMPVKWTGPSMQAGSDQVAVEELEIRHQGIDLSLEMGTPMHYFSSNDAADLSSEAPASTLPEASYYNLYPSPATEEAAEEEAAAEAVEGTTYWNMDRDHTDDEEAEGEAQDAAAE